MSPNTASMPMNNAGVKAANNTINRLCLQFLPRTILHATKEHKIPRTVAMTKAIMPYMIIKKMFIFLLIISYQMVENMILSFSVYMLFQHCLCKGNIFL